LIAIKPVAWPMRTLGKGEERYSRRRFDALATVTPKEA
jgi:hypothetical protein